MSQQVAGAVSPVPSPPQRVAPASPVPRSWGQLSAHEPPRRAAPHLTPPRHAPRPFYPQSLPAPIPCVWFRFLHSPSPGNALLAPSPPPFPPRTTPQDWSLIMCDIYWHHVRCSFASHSGAPAGLRSGRHATPSHAHGLRRWRALDAAPP